MFPFRNTSGQLVRRGRDLHFARYHVDEPEERKAFVAAVKYLLERVPLTCDLDALLARWRWFADGCVGCIGILKTWLVDAVTAALAQGGTSLTIDQLTRTMLHPAKRVSLEMEARAGEHQVETNTIESAMDDAPSVPKTEQVPLHVTPSTLLPQISPKPTKTPVGERSPGRDPVGETKHSREVTKCSFAGSLSLEAAQMAEAGVSKVECPECLTMRALTPQGATVRFPPHDKRKTRTPHREVRWIRHGTVWTLAETKA